MKKTYPDEITPEVLEKLNNVSNEEVLKDIQDTEAEIENKKLALVHERRMFALRAAAAQQGIEERQAFVGFLNRLLDARKTLAGAQ